MTRQDNNLILSDLISCERIAEDEFKVEYTENSNLNDEVAVSVVSSVKKKNKLVNHTKNDFLSEIPQIEQQAGRLNASSLYNFNSN